jgi:hypothetical protein
MALNGRSSANKVPLKSGLGGPESGTMGTSGQGAGVPLPQGTLTIGIAADCRCLGADATRVDIHAFGEPFQKIWLRSWLRGSRFTRRTTPPAEFREQGRERSNQSRNRGDQGGQCLGVHLGDSLSEKLREAN